MKALTERLEWLQLYINGGLGDRADPKQIALAQDIFIEVNAIAEALPEIPVYVDGIHVQPTRQAPKPIIERPSE